MRGIGKGKWARQGAMLGIVLLIGFFALAGCAGTETQADTTRGAMVKLAKNPCAAKNPCNPCAAKNPCAVKNPCNPCAAKNPCNPCAAKNPCNPCAAKNPCNPCNPCGGGKLDPKAISRPAGMKAYSGDRATLVAEGKKLWNDPSIGTSGLACGVCHLNYGNLQKTFLDAYPHRVAMAEQRAGLKQVNSDEMVQLCMVVPMAGKPLGWDSRELAALAAYTEEFQKGFKGAVAANPCLLKASANPCNPCGARNPCNPCAAKNPCNPCAAKNPCNPCAAKNPCNPCAKK